MSIFAGALALVLLAGGASADERPRVPRYTNEDLARVSARHDPITGSVPAPAPEAAPARPSRTERPEPVDETKTEGYWRARARRLEEKLDPLRDQLADLRLQLADRQRAVRARSAAQAPRGSRGTRRPDDESGERLLVARIARLEARIREAELSLEDDARRAGALPGWLR